jgi:hypothetical protein
LAAVGYCAQAIFEEINARGYRGSYQTIKRFVSPLRKEAAIEATVRFKTPPGQQGVEPVAKEAGGKSHCVGDNQVSQRLGTETVLITIIADPERGGSEDGGSDFQDGHDVPGAALLH